MTLRFKPEHFDYVLTKGEHWWDASARIANAHVEKYIRDHGKVVYGNKCGNWYETKPGANSQLSQQGVVLNILPLQKCEHPSEAVKERLSAKGSGGILCSI